MIEVNTDPRWAPRTEEETWDQGFNEIVDEFNAGAQVFAEGVGAIGAAGTRVFWSAADAQLHSYDVLSTERVDYAIPLATAGYLTFEPGASSIVLAEYLGESWHFSVYAADEPKTLLDAIAWPAANAESSPGLMFRPPLSIDGSDVYLLNPEKVLHRWRPGMGAPEPLFSLADRGLVVGNVPRFSVHGDSVLVFDEEAEVAGSNFGGGALWDVGLSEGAAQKVASPALEACFHAGSAIYKVWEEEESEVTLSLRRYASLDGSTEDLTESMLETGVDIGGFPINAARLQSIFNVECQPGGFTFLNDLGIFFFDLEKRETEALHLRKRPDVGEDTFSSVFYTGKVVEHAAFIKRTECPATSGPIAECLPPVLYRRDL